MVKQLLVGRKIVIVIEKDVFIFATATAIIITVVDVYNYDDDILLVLLIIIRVLAVRIIQQTDLHSTEGTDTPKDVVGIRCRICPSLCLVEMVD